MCDVVRGRVALPDDGLETCVHIPEVHERSVRRIGMTVRIGIGVTIRADAQENDRDVLFHRGDYEKPLV